MTPAAIARRRSQLDPGIVQARDDQAERDWAECVARQLARLPAARAWRLCVLFARDGEA